MEGIQVLAGRTVAGFGYDRSAFIDGCREEGSSHSRCACLYEYISARLSHDEYMGVGSDDPGKWPSHVRRVTDDAATTCDGGQPAEPDPATETALSAPRNRPTS